MRQHTFKLVISPLPLVRRKLLPRLRVGYPRLVPCNIRKVRLACRVPRRQLTPGPADSEALARVRALSSVLEVRRCRSGECDKGAGQARGPCSRVLAKV